MPSIIVKDAQTGRTFVFIQFRIYMYIRCRAKITTTVRSESCPIGVDNFILIPKLNSDLNLTKKTP